MLELLSADIKNDPDVFNDKWLRFVLIAFADDPFLVLDVDQKSLNQCLYLIDKLSECAGLRCNVDKSDAV